MDLFEHCFSEAEAGKQIIKQHVIENKQQIALVFPENDSELICVALKYLHYFEKNTQYITAFSSFPLPDFAAYTNLPYKLIQVDEEDMRGIVRYATMVRLSSVKLISLSIPSSQKARELIGFKDIDMDKMVFYGLFEFKEEIS